jgi:mannose-6-phosphate isomerase-like protein (cupin superfamily)
MAPASVQSKVLVRSEQSAGRVAAIQIAVPAGWEGPPLHHHDFDEAFYVLDGELILRVGDELVSARPGALAFAPGGVHHTVANPGAAPARYLLVCTPGGFERYFEPSSSKPYPETTVVGPPIDPGAAPDQVLPVAGDGINVLLRGEESDGRVSIMDNVVPADAKGPFLHTHDFDEAFYVVAGEITFQLGDELIAARAGELAFARGGAAHTFANRSGEAARFVIVCTPAGFERYFARMAAERAGEEPPEWALQEIPEVTRVGPQIGG